MEMGLASMGRAELKLAVIFGHLRYWIFFGSSHTEMNKKKGKKESHINVELIHTAYVGSRLITVCIFQ